jgi:hypothetical protein
MGFVFFFAEELQLCGVCEETGVAVRLFEDGSEDSTNISQKEEDT